ncbi:MAG: HesA/MoeB/ThiF family protein [Pseudomonadota bacterium]
MNPTAGNHTGGTGAGLDDTNLLRYSRQIIMEEIDETGQLRLGDASVLVVGIGGIGGPACLYLAGAGVGRIGLVDFDQVDLSNLQRQIIYGDDDLGRPKTAAALERMEALNDQINIVPHHTRLDHNNAEQLVKAYDLVIDASDNFATRLVLNRACIAMERPMISAALSRFEGQIGIFAPALGAPCYACLYPMAELPDNLSRCDLVGVFGPIAGMLGACAAGEAIKLVLKIGTSLAGSLMLIDLLDLRIQKMWVQPREDCQTCQPRRNQAQKDLSCTTTMT